MDHLFPIKYLIAAALFLGFGSLSAAPSEHKGSLEGRVFDAATFETLPGASLSLPDNGLATISNPLGNFIFGDLGAGTHRLVVRFLGYETDTVEVVVRENETTWVELGLKESGIELGEVDIRADLWADPGKLALIDAKLRPAQSGQDLLTSVPGLLIAQHGGGGKAEQIFLRGFDLDHGTDIALDVDGVPVNMVSHAHGQGYADLHFLIPETVERVDVSKGPYKASQGNLATAGSVSFQTKRGIEGSSLQLEGGSFGRMRALAMVDLTGEKQEKEGKSGYLAGEFLSMRGFFEQPQDLRRMNVLGKYSLPIGKSSTLQIGGQMFRSSWDQSGQLPERAIESGLVTRWGAIDSTEGGATSRAGLNLGLSQALPSGGFIKQQLFATRYSFDLTSNFTFFLNDSINGDAIRQRENRLLYGYRFSHVDKGVLFGIPLNHSAGFSLRMDEVRDLRLDRVLQRETVLESVKSGTVNEMNAAVFVEEALQLSDRLTVTAGLRFDQFQFKYTDMLSDNYRPARSQEGILSPKLRVDLAVTDRVRFYAHSGKGFHSNDSRVAVESGSAALPSAWGVDIGVVVKPVERMVLQAAVWGLDMEQEFVYVGDEGVVEPSGKSLRIGFDLSVRQQISSWIFLDGDLNLSRPRSTSGETAEFIPLAPTLSAIGGLRLVSPKGFSASLRYRYLAPRPANEDWTLSADGFAQFDAHVVHSFSDHLSLGLSCTNLLNQAWKEAQFETTSQLQGEAEPVTEIHYTPGSPRAWNLKMSLNF